MKKYKFEIVVFIVNAVYMILELIASRILSPYFGNSNLVWTSIIGIILLSTSTGNYLGGIIADKRDNEKNVKEILGISGILIMLIPLIQRGVLNNIIKITDSIKIGAIIGTIAIFFLPAMFIGTLSPIIVKIKMNNIENVGKISGKISALATLGSIIGTFEGGFLLIPSFGSNEILFVLSIIMFLLIILVNFENILKKDYINIFAIIGILISAVLFYMFIKNNNENIEKVLKGDTKILASYDTQYGRVLLLNVNKNGELIRHLTVDKGNESATYINENKCFDLVFEYTKYYDLMFKSNKEIKDVLMIGGAGYSYPKHFISNNLESNMDVVEIDGKITQIAKKYFYLDKLINDFDLENNKRLNLIKEDGRTYLNKNTKKYDAILNDAFTGYSPAKTLTTLEAVKKIHDSLNENGLYLSNVISSIQGKNSNFINAEINTIKKVFKNVYVIPCNDMNDLERIQNNMVIATDDVINLEKTATVDYNNGVLLTDNYCPVDTLIPSK